MSMAHGVRALRRTPGFSLLVIATLAVGIGATSAMFSAVWAVFLRPLPVPHQERLVTVWQVGAQSPDVRERVAPANFVDWEVESRSFDALGVLPNWTGEPWIFNVGSNSGLERVRGIYASSGFFRVLGIEPLIGRTLTSEEDRTRGARRVVISHRFWTTRFGGDPGVVGRTIDVDTFRGGAFTIVGVMPRGFDLPRGADIWLSLADWGGGAMPGAGAADRCCAWYTVLGRLKPDVTIEQARAELSAVASRVAQRHPDSGRPDVAIVSLREMLVGGHTLSFVGLFGAVGCVLLIGCANVANLLLSRAVSRRREILTRLALGATRARLARQLLGESLVSGAIGAALGLLLSSWAQAAIRTAMADRVPFIDETRVDLMVVAFSIAMAVAVSAVCGLVPLIDWHAVDWNARGQTESRTSRRFRHALVVAEVAIAVAVVACAGLLVKTVSNLRAIDVGFDTSRTLVVKTDLTTSPLRARGSAAQFVEDVVPRLASLPGVRSAGAATGIPFEAGPAGQPITREGHVPRPAAQSPHIVHSAVTPGYFHAMGIATLRGRTFDARDRADGTLVAVVNQTAARRYWPGEDPIGRRFAIGSSERFGSFRPVKPGEIEWRAIVGVVADVRSAGFALDVQPEVYYNYQQFPLYDPSFVIRTTDADPAALARSVRAEIERINRSAVVTRMRTLEEIVDLSIADPRLRAAVATMFSIVALLLGMFGMYALMSYNVTQQVREIGIRMALGAGRAHVGRMVVGRALGLTTVGVVLGLGMGYLAARSLSTLFFRVSPADPATIAAAGVLLMAAAGAAALVPARHAINVEPAEALRHD